MTPGRSPESCVATDESLVTIPVTIPIETSRDEERWR